MLKINEYIESGILESYVLGSASERETRELFKLKEQYPQIQEALQFIELDAERMAQEMAITPPPRVWEKIEEQINDLKALPSGEFLIGDPPPRARDEKTHRSKGSQFIEIESESGHMRIRKVWRWVFAAVFLIGKVFLAFAIYFYLENRQSEKTIARLEQQLMHQQSTK